MTFPFVNISNFHFLAGAVIGYFLFGYFEVQFEYLKKYEEITNYAKIFKKILDKYTIVQYIITAHNDSEFLRKSSVFEINRDAQDTQDEKICVICG